MKIDLQLRRQWICGLLGGRNAFKSIPYVSCTESEIPGSSLCQFSHAVHRSPIRSPRRRFTTHCSNLGAQAERGGADATAARKAMLIDERSILSLALLSRSRWRLVNIALISGLNFQRKWSAVRIGYCDYRTLKICFNHIYLF